jgi:hypothetical protein
MSLAKEMFALPTYMYRSLSIFKKRVSIRTNRYERFLSNPDENPFENEVVTCYLFSLKFSQSNHQRVSFVYRLNEECPHQVT